MDIMKNVFSSKNILLMENHIFTKPFMKFKTKIIPFALVGSAMLSLTKCETGMDKTKEGLSDIGIEIEDVSDLNDMYYITKISEGGDSEYGDFDYSVLKDVLD